MPTTTRTLSIYLNINSHNSQKKITSDRVILIKLRASNSSNIVVLLHSIFCLANKESHRSYNSRKNMFAERHVQKVGWSLAQFWFRNTYKKSADLRHKNWHQKKLIFRQIRLYYENFWTKVGNTGFRELLLTKMILLKSTLVAYFIWVLQYGRFRPFFGRTLLIW